MLEANTKRAGLEEKIAERAAADPNFRSAFVANPKETLKKEFGMSLPDNLQVKVVEETPDLVYVRLPLQASQLSEEMLEMVSGGSDPACGCFCY